MTLKRILSFILCAVIVMSSFAFTTIAEDSDNTRRIVYLHAQGEHPGKSTFNDAMSTVYMGDKVDLYFAIDNPNKGEYDGAKPKYPQYALNGYTVTVYYNPDYFTYTGTGEDRIIYDLWEGEFDIYDKEDDVTLPETNNKPTDNVPSFGDDEAIVPGFYEHRHTLETKTVNKIEYRGVRLSVFLSGGYYPKKDDQDAVYNLCKLPLEPDKPGVSDVFIDVDGREEYTLELFAKNTTGDINDQTFNFTTINGGRHTIQIKEKLKPSPPVPTPMEGRYTGIQYVTLDAEEGCDIYYLENNETEFRKYTEGEKIEVDVSGTIKCYAVRLSDGKPSDTVTYTYKIVPGAPHLFDEKEKKLIPNIYSQTSEYNVFVSDKDVFENFDEGTYIYYTFSENLDAENYALNLSDNPENGWVQVINKDVPIKINKNRTVRLIASKSGEISDVSWYHLGISPSPVEANYPSGEYDKKIDVTLSTPTKNAKIYYTYDNSSPLNNPDRMEYQSGDYITLSKDTTIKAVAFYDGLYSEVTSFHYVFNFYDDDGVDAFYPSGRYEGSVNVTLTPNNPDNEVWYSLDGSEPQKYDEVITVDKDTVITAYIKKPGEDELKKVDEFKYYIRPLPPEFSPISTQFTNADKVTVFCVESTSGDVENPTTGRFDLFYTLDESDPSDENNPNRIQADSEKDSVEITIEKYTVIKAVVLKDRTAYSDVITHSYDIVTKKPVKPLMTLLPGEYIHKIENEDGYTTQFLPVPEGTVIWYTVGKKGEFIEDPKPGQGSTKQYIPGDVIKVEGSMVIKAVAVNVFDVSSDVGVFEYTIIPEAPKSAPNATVDEDKLPVVPVYTVKGSDVTYETGNKSNTLKADEIGDDGMFYIDTSTGNAYNTYENGQLNDPIGTALDLNMGTKAQLLLSAELNGVKSDDSYYIYQLNQKAQEVLAPPYADKETGIYEEIKIDDDNNLLYVSLYSLNTNDTIYYRIDNAPHDWVAYDGNPLKLKEYTVLQLKSVRNGTESEIVSYVYDFIPLPPVISLPSGRYERDDEKIKQVKIDYAEDIPTDKDYTIFYRYNGNTEDIEYYNHNTSSFSVSKTMSCKAYVVNNATGKVSKNTIHHYIVEDPTGTGGTVYLADPYGSESRIATERLDESPYSNGIAILSKSDDPTATINYNYHYNYKTDTESGTKYSNNRVYDNNPIFVSPIMQDITINAWLTREDGSIIEDSYKSFYIDFVELGVPTTTLEALNKDEFSKGDKGEVINAHHTDKNVTLYYTLDGSDPTDKNNSARINWANNKEFTLGSGITTVKAFYYSVCGTCTNCYEGLECSRPVEGKIGTYTYSVPVEHYTGGSGGGGGGGGRTTIDNTRKYTKDIFGNEHPTHISYINGYPDGSVQADGNITREEIASILYRITNHQYEEPFVTTGKVFPDVEYGRWSDTEIEYMADKGIVLGYPDGEFKPARKLTRAEFAALICRFTGLTKSGRHSFPDLSEDHWAYENIMVLCEAKLMQGYEDKTFRPENNITRAEVMTVVNKILGRCPDHDYVKGLDYNPYTDLMEEKWYYVDVIEATITHNYYLNDKETLEIKWEDIK